MESHHSWGQFVQQNKTSDPWTALLRNRVVLLWRAHIFLHLILQTSCTFARRAILRGLFNRELEDFSARWPSTLTVSFRKCSSATSSHPAAAKASNSLNLVAISFSTSFHWASDRPHVLRLSEKIWARVSSVHELGNQKKGGGRELV